jgi:hypothetical protein
MQKNPDRQTEDAPEVPKKQKARRNRRETECRDKIRAFDRCGVCGSEDLVFEVLDYCPTCGAEKLDLDITGWRFYTRAEIGLCHCEGHRRLVLSSSSFVVAHCNTCRAHKGPRCRNCGSASWYRFDPEKPMFHCIGCGFATL